MENSRINPYVSVHVVVQFYPWFKYYIPLFWSMVRVELNPRDREKCTPLLLAAAHGCPAVVSYLLESGADVTCEDDKSSGVHFSRSRGFNSTP